MECFSCVLLRQFKSLSHFEFIFVYGVRVCSNFIDLMRLSNFQHHLLKRLPFPHCTFWWTFKVVYRNASGFRFYFLYPSSCIPLPWGACSVYVGLLGLILWNLFPSQCVSTVLFFVFNRVKIENPSSHK